MEGSSELLAQNEPPTMNKARIHVLPRYAKILVPDERQHYSSPPRPRRFPLSQGIDASRLTYVFDGRYLAGEDTGLALEMEDYEVVDCMLDLVEDPRVLVSESGIRTGEDLLRLRQHDINIALVGENLMREPDPGEALAEMLAIVDPPPA